MTVASLSENGAPADFFRHPIKAAVLLNSERKTQRQALRARPLFMALDHAAMLHAAETKAPINFVDPTARPLVSIRPATIKTPDSKPLKVLVDCEQGVFMVMVDNVNFRKPLRAELGLDPRGEVLVPLAPISQETDMRREQIMAYDFEMRRSRLPPLSRDAPSTRVRDDHER
jgi:hypothetical protein